LRSRLIQREDLDGATREAMYRLLAGHFDGVTRERFDADLAEKTWVLLLEDDGGLRGFSTLFLYETSVPGEGVCTVVYSGDTIVDPSAWGSAALPRCWIAAVRRLREEYPKGRLWWLLLTSGFRTYRLLPVFWKDFWPRWDAPAPPDVQARLDALARERLGGAYRAEDGITCFPEPQKLRGDLAEVPPGRKSDPHVAYFLDRNPGWAEGDELVCLTEIAEENLTAAGRRMWRAGAGLKDDLG
jgi:hypothetical protein